MPRGGGGAWFVVPKLEMNMHIHAPTVDGLVELRTIHILGQQRSLMPDIAQGFGLAQTQISETRAQGIVRIYILSLSLAKNPSRGSYKNI